MQLIFQSEKCFKHGIFSKYSRTSQPRTRRDCQNVLEPLRFRNFREKKSGSDPGQFHYAMITDVQFHGSS